MFCWAIHLTGGQPKLGPQSVVPVHHEVYAFGELCESDDKAQIGVHIFNTVSLRWRTLTPGRGVPSSRCRHSAVLVEDVIYLWGGRQRYSYEYELYAFDVDTHGWFKPKVFGNVPGLRWDHSACVFGKVMFIHGGCTHIGWTNDPYKLDTTTMAWSVVNTRGTTYFSYDHSATDIGTKMFVFGRARDQYHNILRVFDTENDLWMDTPSVPPGCWSHSAFAYNGELYIFGCETNVNNLWKFNPERLSWMKVEPTGNVPSNMYGMFCCVVGDRVLVFRRSSDDVFVLDLRPSLKTLCELAVAQCGLEQSELPHNIRWELAAMTATNGNPGPVSI